MKILKYTKTYENCPNGCKGISYLNDDNEQKDCITCNAKWNRITNELVKERNKQELSKEAKNKPDGYTLLGTGWVSIEETQPKPQERVYVVCEKPKYGGGVVRLQTMAEYIPYMTVKEEDYMADEYQGDCDYNEEEDEYYTPEGFYEWQSEPDMYWKISAKVTHWMPLIALP